MDPELNDIYSTMEHYAQIFGDPNATPGDREGAKTGLKDALGHLVRYKDTNTERMLLTVNDCIKFYKHLVATHPDPNVVEAANLAHGFILGEYRQLTFFGNSPEPNLTKREWYSRLRPEVFTQEEELERIIAIERHLDKVLKAEMEKLNG